MKKILTSILVTVVLLITLFFGFKTIKVKSAKPSNQIIQITAMKFNQLSKSNKENIILYGDKTCGACKEYLPVITKKAKEYHQKIYYLDADKTTNRKFANSKGITVTPSIIIAGHNNKLNIFKGTLSSNKTEALIANLNSRKKTTVRNIPLTYQKFVKLQKNNISYPVYIKRNDCSDCQIFDKILSKFISQKQNGFYTLDLSELTNKNKEKVLYKYKINWVPTLLVIHGTHSFYKTELFKTSKKPSKNLSKLEKWYTTYLSE